MSTFSIRRRAIIGGLFSLAVVMAPLAITASGSAGAATPSVVRPFLASPRTFPPAQLTFTVNTGNDTDAANPSSGVCADAGGMCSLRAAVDVANTTGQTTVINLPPGNYGLQSSLVNSDPAGTEIVGGGASVTNISGLTVGHAALVTTQTASTAGAFLALVNLEVTNTNNTGGTLQGGGLWIGDQNDTVTLDGVTFSGDSANTGGAIYNHGQLWATGCTFTGNSVVGTTTGQGGAIYTDHAAARLSNDTFIGNTATVEGGALRQNDGPIAIDNSTFSSNSVNATGSTTAEGGAIYAADEMEFTNDTFTGNSANNSTGHANGGAVYDQYGLNLIAGSTFTGNSISGASGDSNEGGAFYDNNAVAITSTTFTNNTATNGAGGAIAEESDGLVLNGDVLSGNQATGTNVTSNGRGGALYSDDISNILNTLITQNHADVGGGAFYLDDGIIMNNSTVSANTSNLGGGIDAAWSIQITASAIVDNSTSGPNDAGGGFYIPAGGNNRVDLIGTTVAGNVSDNGAGFMMVSDEQGGGGSLANSTVADNRTPAGVEQDCGFSGTVPLGRPLGSGGGNVVGDTTCGFSTSSDRQGPSQQGYWLTATDGGIFGFNGGFFGSMGNKVLNKPVVGMAHTPGNQGYIEVASDGGVFTFGDAGFYGSMGNVVLNKPVVGIAMTPDGKGYIEVASDGGVFTFGNAGFYGSLGAVHLNKPIVGIALTPDGRGYWMTATDGGVFAFGDAGYFGSMGNVVLNKPVVGIAAATDGAGYYLVAADGGIFRFGSARFEGSAGNLHLNAPVVGMAAAPTNDGYWLFAADGGVFNYGPSATSGAVFQGSAGALHLNKPIVGGAGT
jgi:CSLREA domain-containing protein